MNRKGFLILVIAVLVVGGAFAQMPEFKLSAGAGGYFTSDFGGGYEYTVGSNLYENKIPYYGGGGLVFFDATYVELSLGFFAAGGSFKMYCDGTQFNKYDMSRTGLDIGLLGKYPFALGEQFTLFPLLGITYRRFISVKTDLPAFYVPSSAGDLSVLWFKLGAGADFTFTDHIFARLGVVYGIRLKNKWEKYLVNEDYGHNMKIRLGHGLDVKLAVGYRF